jgi:hypothetical protein
VGGDCGNGDENEGGNFEDIGTHGQRLLATVTSVRKKKSSRKAARNLQQKYCDQTIFVWLWATHFLTVD